MTGDYENRIVIRECSDGPYMHPTVYRAYEENGFNLRLAAYDRKSLHDRIRAYWPQAIIRDDFPKTDQSLELALETWADDGGNNLG